MAHDKTRKQTCVVFSIVLNFRSGQRTKILWTRLQCSNTRGLILGIRKDKTSKMKRMNEILLFFSYFIHFEDNCKEKMVMKSVQERR